jgi:hypothetical protein
MNLEQVLHQRWSDNAALDALLPAQRVTTGRSSEGSLPRATITRRSRRTVCHTNSGETIEDVSIEIRIRHESFDDATAIVEQFLVVFNRSQFDLVDGARVLSFRRTEEHCDQLDDGTWQLQVEMLARIQLPTQ